LAGGVIGRAMPLKNGIISRIRQPIDGDFYGKNTDFPIPFANWRLLPAAQNRSFNLWDEGRQLDSQDDG
jgi:hypothetical protein